MRLYLFVFSAGLMLSGCDQEKGSFDYVMNDYFQEPNITISPGFKIDDHGHMSKVYGFSECPQSFLSPVRESGCIIVNPADKAIPVLVDYGDSSHRTATKEVWEVERHGEFPHNSILFKRPDRSYVVPFQ